MTVSLERIRIFLVESIGYSEEELEEYTNKELYDDLFPNQKEEYLAWL